MTLLPTKAITKSELNRRNDKQAAARYSRRRDIDNRNAERRLQQQLREVWDG
ncbi:PA3496 family putative envelope integrity protein [Halomonas sp. LS-001]